MPRIFVYGTLKRNQPNNYILEDSTNGAAVFVNRGKLLHPRPLIIASAYNIPFLLDQPGTGYMVAGEVYEIDDKMLQKLDELEGYPHFYDRMQVDIELDADGLSAPYKTESVWCYIFKNFKSSLLEQPYLESYDSNGPHGLVYVASGGNELVDPAQV